MLEFIHNWWAHILTALGLVAAGAIAAPKASGGSQGAAAAPEPTSTPQHPAATPHGPPDGLDAEVLMELVHHEAIVAEAYKDSKGIWTWSIGITDASGHTVERYIDNPQTIKHCLEVFVWLVRNKYLPDVLKAFAGYPLTKAQLAAALSFHYNTGAIKKCTWVQQVKAGNHAAAREAIMQWCHPASIIGRRQAERDLFFDGKWANNGTATVFPVLKPSYQPSFRKGYKVNISADLKELLG